MVLKENCGWMEADAIYDFSANADDELGFKKGAFLKVRALRVIMMPFILGIQIRSISQM